MSATLDDLLGMLQEINRSVRADKESRLSFRAQLPGYDGSIGHVTINGADTTTSGLADGKVHCADTGAHYLVKNLYIYNPAANTGTINVVAGPSNDSQILVPIPKGTVVLCFKDVSPSRLFFSVTNSPAATDVFYIWWGG